MPNSTSSRKSPPRANFSRTDGTGGGKAKHGGPRADSTPAKLMYIASILVILYTLLGDKSLLHLHSLVTQKKILEEKTEGIEHLTLKMENDLFALIKDPNTLEALAREELGLAKKGERVYIFPRSDG